MAGAPSEQGEGGSLMPGRGVIAWMAENPVASNLLMVFLLFAGGLTLLQIKQEVFPEFELDVITVHATYVGAAPTEVESGVVAPIEEAVRTIEGLKEVRATAAEGMGIVTIELLRGTNADRALSDVKSAVDRITAFPEAIERPVVSLFGFKMKVVTVAVHGSADPHVLRDYAEKVRLDLMGDDAVTYVELGSARAHEIAIEVPEATLRKLNFSLGEIAEKVRQGSVESPGGSLRTASGEVLLRTDERRLRGSQFESIILREGDKGALLRLSDVATIRDDFEESDDEATFNGEPAVLVGLYRVGDESPLTVSEAAKRYLAEQEGKLPDGVQLSLWNDQSEFLRGRIDLLLRNAFLGLLLVLGVLGLFLELKLAFWVTAGIPISFIGAFVLLPLFGNVSINMISLFGFIITLGMVVDDAVVVGEAIHLERGRGSTPLHAAINGAREVARPVIFSIATTCMAFMPLMFVPGVYGKFFMQMPVVVVLVLLLSLVESLLILPAHLAHSTPIEAPGWRNYLLRSVGIGHLSRAQSRFGRWFEGAVIRYYVPLLARVLRARGLTLAIAASALVLCVGLVLGGRLQAEFFPRIEQDFAGVEVTLPYGTPVAETRAIQARVIAAAQASLEALGGAERYGQGIMARVGRIGLQDEFSEDKNREASAHQTEVVVGFVPAAERPFGLSAFVREWRSRLADITGIDKLHYRYTTDVGSGSPIHFRLSHRDIETLNAAASELGGRLRDYSGVEEVDKGSRAGKEERLFRLTDEGSALGLTAADLATQVRHAFYGAEALRYQRGRDEVKVMVRLPRAEREVLSTLENLRLRTKARGEIALGEAAVVEPTRGYTEIERHNGRRVLNVTAEVSEDANAGAINAAVEADLMPQLLARYPGLHYELGGDQAAQKETQAGMAIGFALAIFAIFALLAVAFRSYAQPLLIMSAIPFGIVGATVGHLLLGYKISIMSFFGFVALSGVVVNDSLILLASINTYRARGMGVSTATRRAARRRFRPILLTSLTTFFGLTPMILETSLQARFLIPMALSLGFGVLFATLIILLMLPALYLQVCGVRFAFKRRARARLRARGARDQAAALLDLGR